MSRRDVVAKIDALLCQHCWHVKVGTEHQPPACTCGNQRWSFDIRREAAERQLQQELHPYRGGRPAKQGRRRRAA